MNKDLVVILIIAHKSQINEFEKISLQQCYKVLGHYPIRLICPRGLDISCYQEIVPKVQVEYIDPRWQSTYENFNRLKVAPLLYRKFRRYEFILFYELDAFVFRDELEYWCSQNYDYIGAPWFSGYDEAEEILPFSGVGNGGFSLRKVESSLRALYSFSYIASPSELWSSWKASNGSVQDTISLVKSLTVTNNTFFLFNGFKWHEDLFWGKHVNQNFDWFRVPTENEALKFSFEINPEYLFEKNNRVLPFGCHGWWKYRQDFWWPKIKSFGYLEENAELVR
jgi:Protein of unknown function (DUF5672)